MGAAGSGPAPGEAAGSGPPKWLLQTKLQPPLPRSDVIHRPRLFAALRNTLTSHRLILISAPAGYGKTTLLADFRLTMADSGSSSPDATIQNQKSKIQNRTAWLTLDEEDNDPVLFLSYLIAALQSLHPTCGATAQSLLASPTGSPFPLTQIVGVLINDILETLADPFALILDDLHRITEPAVFTALDYLLEHLPPQMHLIIATRYDPPLALARLRARGHLAELRLAELRFTDDETTSFLNERLRLGLSPDDLASLQARTEGWPVGLRLLAGSLDRLTAAAERTAFITALARTDRHIFDFLADEVLAHQPPDVRRFLLETSILPELTAPLCAAVTGRADAVAILEELNRRNLLLTLQPTPSNLQSATYRYHALFAEFLRRRLEREMPERIRDLHRRAALAERDPGRAIQHYLAAERWEDAARIIESIGEQIVQQGLLTTLADWIQALPPPVRTERPSLTYLLGVCAWQRGEIGTAEALLKQALDLFEAQGDQAGQGRVLADLVTCALLQADLERSEKLSRRALARPLPPPSRVQLLVERAGQELLQGRWAEAEADLEEARAVAQESDDPEVIYSLAYHLDPIFVLVPGGLACLERACSQALAHLGTWISPLRVAVESRLAFVHVWRGRMTKGIRLGESALAHHARLGGQSTIEVLEAAAIVAAAHAARGEYAAADRLFDLVLQSVGQVTISEEVAAGFLYLLGRTRWLQGRREEARLVYDQMHAFAHPAEPPLAPALRQMMHGLLEIGEQHYAEAERCLYRAVLLEEKARLAALFGSARLLLAHLYAKMDRPHEALAELSLLLARCEREGTPGLILKEGALAVPVLRLAVEQGVHASFAARLLDILGVGDEPRPLPIPETGETLTRREVQILRLIAQGLSNRAIAEQLVVSEGTVKTHVHRILRKLDAASRTEAAARARRLLRRNSP